MANSNNHILKQEILDISNNGLDFFKLIFGDKLQLENDQRCKNVKNTFYNDKKASLSIYLSKRGIWSFRDYGNTDYNGDVYDFASIYYSLSIKNDFQLILNKMKYDLLNNHISLANHKLSNSKFTNTISKEVKEVCLMEIEFTNKALKFWNSFGITLQILKQNNVKEITGVKLIYADGNIEVKNYQLEMVFAYKIGNGAKIYCPNPKKFWYVGSNAKDYVFGQNFFTNSPFCFLVGGEKDVMTLHGLGYEAICLSSETAIPSKRILKDLVESNSNPIILYDCDETGKLNAKKLSQKFDWRVADLSLILSNTQSIKDVSDYIKSNLSIDTLKTFLDAFLKLESTQPKEEDEDFEDLEDLEDLEDSNEERNENVYKTIPSSVYANLPNLLKSVVEKINQDHKRDLVLTGSLSVLSNLLNVSGTYGNIDVFPNLYLFITAPASAGKGVLRWVRKLGDALNNRYKLEYKNALEIYEENGKKGEKPKRKTVFVSANSSIAALLKQLDINGGKGIMFESEADALNGVMQNQWGNLSDVLRRCFEFEPLSSLRVDDEKTFEIDKPRLSIVLTGTKNQLFDLIPNSQNGLFSRFLFFEFPLVKTWESPFESKQNFDGHYFNLSKTIMSFYDITKQRNVRFSMSESQEKQFDEMYINWQNKYDVLLGGDSFASVRRIANMQFRIAMIISTIRMLEHNNITEDLKCSDIDFETSEILAKWFINHTEKIYQQLPNKPQSYTILKTIEAQFYDDLPSPFIFKQAIELAEKMNIAKGTAERFLRKFSQVKLITRVRHGEYSKCENL